VGGRAALPLDQSIVSWLNSACACGLSIVCVPACVRVCVCRAPPRAQCKTRAGVLVRCLATIIWRTTISADEPSVLVLRLVPLPAVGEGGGGGKACCARHLASLIRAHAWVGPRAEVCAWDAEAQGRVVKGGRLWDSVRAQATEGSCAYADPLDLL
jgi:hypothetical protein